jgi:hypothetical protein
MISWRSVRSWILERTGCSTAQLIVLAADKRSFDASEEFLREMASCEKRRRRLAGTHDLHTRAHVASTALSLRDRPMIESINSGGNRVRRVADSPVLLFEHVH